ncbi:hypothetical protein PV325_007445, partial [Microctonus aethiopoides]
MPTHTTRSGEDTNDRHSSGTYQALVWMCSIRATALICHPRRQEVTELTLGSRKIAQLITDWQKPLHHTQHADQAGKSVKTALHGVVGHIERALHSKNSVLGVLKRKPRVRYSGAARRRFKKEQRKLGAEQVQGTSAPELGDGSKAQG